MADSRIRERIFAQTSVAAAEQQLRKIVAAAAGTSSIGATQLLRDHYRDQTEPRHPVTRWA